MQIGTVILLNLWGGAPSLILNFFMFLSVFQVASSIISSINLTPVVYYRYQFVVSISFTAFRIMKFLWRKKRPIVPRHQGTMGHWLGHNKHIETLPLIFIYLSYASK